MFAMAKVKGLDEVLRNFNKHIDRTDKNARTAFQAIGAYLKGKTLPLTPIDDGDLRNSIFYSTDNAKDGARLRVGFTAKHAPWVHEMPGSNNFNSPGTGPKFLEKSVKQNQKSILQIALRFLKV